ncbi:MAG: PorT family protein [Flavobacterium sp.]|uniref:porin family protein n=1 Tax=Flavobacterium sp. TaxID=239 RepID=UPI00121EE056|nr:porin family protein [Flavobacterium sp.]RZJ67757.1 MAG: PorT family protein [Flavobacterium sp.]
MKKLIFCACAMFAFGFANAQSETVKFGVKAGFVHTNLVADDLDGADDFDYDSKIGGYIGGLVDLPISGNFHLQPELLFVAEGADQVSLIYARIPVLAKYYIIQNLALQAGPTFGILLDAEDNADDYLKRGDVALTGGATYEFDFGLFVDARFNAGLLNISDVGGEIRTASFMVGAGYRF